MGSPEKPVDVEMGDMGDESTQLNPEKTSDDQAEKSTRFTGLTKEELLGMLTTFFSKLLNL